MSTAVHVEDWSGIPDGNAAIAALSLGLAYVCMHVTPAHHDFLLKTVDVGLVPWFSVPGPLFAGDTVKAQIAKHFPPAPQIKDSDSGSDSSEGDD